MEHVVQAQLCLILHASAARQHVQQLLPTQFYQGDGVTGSVPAAAHEWLRQFKAAGLQRSHPSEGCMGSLSIYRWHSDKD